MILDYLGTPQGVLVPLSRGRFHTHRGEGNVTTEAVTGVMRPRARERWFRQGTGAPRTLQGEGGGLTS